jgi:hypothetical protein
MPENTRPCPDCHNNYWVKHMRCHGRGCSRCEDNGSIPCLNAYKDWHKKFFYLPLRPTSGQYANPLSGSQAIEEAKKWLPNLPEGRLTTHSSNPDMIVVLADSPNNDPETRTLVEIALVNKYTGEAYSLLI